MKRKVFIVLIGMILLAGLISCASQQLTKDQEARIILNAIQDNLNTLFDTGKAMSTTKPEYQETWKVKIVPAFNLANKALKDGMELAKQGKFTPADVNAKVTPLVNLVIVYLAQIGVIK